MTARRPSRSAARSRTAPRGSWMLAGGGVLLAAALVFALYGNRLFRGHEETRQAAVPSASRAPLPDDVWLQRAYLLRPLYVAHYSPGWEAANGAIGDAYLYAATQDTTLLRFHMKEHDLLDLFDGTWVDDRAWNALAELAWWNVTGRRNRLLVESAKHRYLTARDEGRLSKHEGFWSWYNWPPNAQVNEPVFTNSNMNQMATVACLLYEATGEKRFLDDALLVWNGDATAPGVEKTLYRGGGVWKGKSGRAAWGKQLPWEGVEYCPLEAALYRLTHDPKYKAIAVATVRRVMDPRNGWVDATDYYQIRMDGNGAFVRSLMEAYEIAPDELRDIPGKVEKMLTHVWTNHHGSARVVLHRETDNAIRNGWNPNGGEDGYGVDEVGSLHAQTQALLAFSIFASFRIHPHFWPATQQH